MFTMINMYQHCAEQNLTQVSRQQKTQEQYRDSAINDSLFTLF